MVHSFQRSPQVRRAKTDHVLSLPTSHRARVCLRSRFARLAPSLVYGCPPRRSDAPLRAPIGRFLLSSVSLPIERLPLCYVPGAREGEAQRNRRYRGGFPPAPTQSCVCRQRRSAAAEIAPARTHRHFPLFQASRLALVVASFYFVPPWLLLSGGERHCATRDPWNLPVSLTPN